MSIDILVDRLVDGGFLRNSDHGGGSGELGASAAQQLLVFAVISWQTMLYVPDLSSGMPAPSSPLLRLAIADDLDGHTGLARMYLKQSASACSQPLHELLLGYGMLLPPSNWSAGDSDEEQKALSSMRTAEPASCNAHLLESVGRLHIRWVDSIACHLEFDATTSTLFLFRYPSFCAANLAANTTAAASANINADANANANVSSSDTGLIYACAAPRAGMQWATADDVRRLLHETLLTYRLLSGQSAASGKLFRKLKPYDDGDGDGGGGVPPEAATSCSTRYARTSASPRSASRHRCRSR
jgi:hypothetical protein